MIETSSIWIIYLPGPASSEGYLLVQIPLTSSMGENAQYRIDAGGWFSVRKEPLPFDVPVNRLPRLFYLPLPRTPVLFLPVPDPTSFHLLVHWMYFGHTNYIRKSVLMGASYN